MVKLKSLFKPILEISVVLVIFYILADLTGRSIKLEEDVSNLKRLAIKEYTKSLMKEKE